MSEEIKHDELVHLLSYHPLTGEFRWKNPRALMHKPNDLAGHENHNGYWCITIRGKPYMAHRLAWFYIHKQWPKDQLDHINDNKLDNRIENLRECNQAQNNKWKWETYWKNYDTKSNRNSTGERGITRNRKKYKVQIKHDYLGTYETLKEAIAVRDEYLRNM